MSNLDTKQYIEKLVEYTKNLAEDQPKKTKAMSKALLISAGICTSSGKRKKLYE